MWSRDKRPRPGWKVQCFPGHRDKCRNGHEAYAGPIRARLRALQEPPEKIALDTKMGAHRAEASVVTVHREREGLFERGVCTEERLRQGERQPLSMTLFELRWSQSYRQSWAFSVPWFNKLSFSLHSLCRMMKVSFVSETLNGES